MSRKSFNTKGLEKIRVIEAKEDLIKKKLIKQIMLKKEEIKRLKSLDVRHFGLPDLLFPINYYPAKIQYTKGKYVVHKREHLENKETIEEYKERRFVFLKEFIEKEISIVAHGRTQKLKLVDPVLNFVGDLFFGYVKRAILWKSRGGGGSLAAALVMWLLMIYKKKSFLDIAGSGEQALNMYNYTVMFWDCFPRLKKGMIEGKPLISKTKLKTGISLKCLTTTEKSARGKHEPGLCLDEACQENQETDKVFTSYLNGTLPVPDHTIIMLSTFHVPIGFFQENWDYADEKGLKRYFWDVYDIMKLCNAGMEFATKEDPLAIKSFCMEKCPLTFSVEEKIFENGELKLYKKVMGCKGKARKSNGFMDRSVVIETMSVNRGSSTFDVEFGGQRPSVPGSTYSTEDIDAAIKTNIDIPKDSPFSAVGIDWGFVEGCLVYLKMTPRGVAILDVCFMNLQTIEFAKKKIDEWFSLYGVGNIYPDSSHQFNNQELQSYFEEDGLSEYCCDVVPVVFATMKDYAIKNMKKFFINKKIEILNDGSNKDVQKYIMQMKKYTGKKKDDHGPDASICTVVDLDFDDYFSVNSKFDYQEYASRGSIEDNDEEDSDDYFCGEDGHVMLF